MSIYLTEVKAPTMNDLFSIATGAISASSGFNPNTKSKKSSYSYSSIARAASDLVAVFPVIVSRTVSSDTAHMAAKYIEQISCQFIMLALQQANIDTAEDGISYLRKFHQNLDIGGDGVDVIVKTMQNWINAYKSGKITESGTFANTMIREMAEKEEFIDYYSIMENDRDLEVSASDMNALLEMMKANENLTFYDTDMNPISINDFSVNESDGGTYHVFISPINEAKRPKPTPAPNPAPTPAPNPGYHATATDDELYNPKANKRKYKYNNPMVNPGGLDDEDFERWYLKFSHSSYEDEVLGSYDDLISRRDSERANTEYKHKEDEYKYKKYKRDDEDRYNHAKRKKDDKYVDYTRREEKRSRRDEEYGRSHGGKNISILKDQDIKKMNDAIPSILVIKFYHRYTDGGVSTVPTEFIVGIKSKLIPVTTEEILRRIMNDNKDGKKFITFMRTMTGELSIPDIIFSLSRIKDDVKSCKVKNAYGDTWNLLANRARAAREQIKHGQRNDFSAITTVIISQYDADELYREENFDIADPRNAYHFMQSYNLMAFGIVDDATESFKILFDNGSKQFDEIAYRMLERETQDGTYKKLINLMAASK